MNEHMQFDNKGKRRYWFAKTTGNWLYTQENTSQKVSKPFQMLPANYRHFWWYVLDKSIFGNSYPLCNCENKYSELVNMDLTFGFNIETKGVA